MVTFAYRCLLTALPISSRARVGEDLLDTLVADVASASGSAAIGRFFANATDLVRSGLAERRQRRLPGPTHTPSGPMEPIRRVLNDARVALRSFAKAPGFSAVAILSIALGIGLNTTIFSVVNALLLRPVPATDPDRLVTIFTSGYGNELSSSSYPDFVDLASSNTTLSGLAARTLMFAGVERGESTAITVGEIVSPNYFDVLGVRLAAGRGFAAGTERPDVAPTAIISHRMWMRDFGGHADAVGRDLIIRGRKYAIVGVAPAQFNGLAAGVSAELWVPAGCVDDIEPVGMNDSSPSPSGSHKNERRGQRYLMLVGRLARGVTIAQAQANLHTLMAGIEHEYPQSNENRDAIVMRANAVRLLPGVDGALAPSAAVLMAAVGLVLLVACSNIASLLLARATSRAKEMALRVAIGATRWQIVQQLLVESLLLSLIGGATGLVLVTWLAGLLGRIQPPMQISIAFDFAPDARVFVFTFLLATATGLLFGLVPALKASRPNLVPALKGEAEFIRTRRVTMRSALVAGQMAMSMVLLVVAGLFFRSFLAASATDVGFDVNRLVYAAINSSKEFSDSASAQRFFEDAERRVRALPGVVSVARTDRLPFALTNNTSVVSIDGVRGAAEDGGILADVSNVSHDYFATLGIPIVAGRAIDARDRGANTQPVVVINQTAARKYFANQDPLGRHVRVGKTGDFIIVGVSADHPVRAVGEAPRPYFQFAIDQTQVGFANLVIRTDGSARDLTPLVRRELLALQPRMAFLGLEPMTGMVDATLFPARAAMVLLGCFGALATVLAVVGLYGVVSFNVARQTRDIGIRMALGAGRGRVVADVLRHSGTLVLYGLIADGVLAVGAAQVLSGFLVGVSALDPVSYAAAALVLAVAALMAGVVPAHRAATIDPITALRRQ